MITLRSILFNVIFLLWLFIILITLWVFLPFPRAAMVAGVRIWVKGSLWILRVVLGIRHEIRGRENLPNGAGIIAAKHQSVWEALVFYALCADPVYVLKKELMSIPAWGRYARKVEAIEVDRSGGASTLKRMAAAVRYALDHGRTVIIFPEGTRSAPDDEAIYQPGIAALYRNSNTPVVPVALNSGLFWGSDNIKKYAGTIILEFLPPIPVGLPRREFMKRLESDIETASKRLVIEGRAAHPNLPAAP